ncbi:hypothetical protein GCM10011392_30810 [Wenxinia marina]|nr:hypothetical protein GCM10011392_30810 [Wenxinia marina]
MTPPRPPAGARWSAPPPSGSRLRAGTGLQRDARPGPEWGLSLPPGTFGQAHERHGRPRCPFAQRGANASGDPSPSHRATIIPGEVLTEPASGKTEGSAPRGSAPRGQAVRPPQASDVTHRIVASSGLTETTLCPIVAS